MLETLGEGRGDGRDEERLRSRAQAEFVMSKRTAIPFIFHILKE